MCQDEATLNGWTAVPVDAGRIFGDLPFLNEPSPVSIRDISFPSDDPVVAQTLRYAKERLHAETFNHSMRVFYYGMTISKQQFPDKAAALSPSTWALACLLHDIGTADESLTATRMSFDIYGGFKALLVLKDHGATPDQAEAVAEAIVRHQDTGVDGTITFLGQLIQLATLYDNVGRHPCVKDFGKMIHEATRAEVNGTHPRMKWCSFFASTVRKEVGLKPWCHSTHIVNFDNEVESNTLMSAWE
ncbi:cyanamide hydratase family HD domain-containing protein [Colletotrichum navitas]|uniref:Cyanamide hydratase family HD domain-containing protein n=1 Tax=Colletotrichum navitas TaxID=681940 RepID=A0AAD8Q7X4_9PEZI|nr:cyanamide hydratase family HD domain-containing protein [Colletotrichum navitas]KAK1597279.1 cyanamide hydratase family HD domain-containing protein [Colletotrichum navitas]